eukprot:jgi/Bigna1/131496/aug1.14_g6204
MTMGVFVEPNDNIKVANAVPLKITLGDFATNVSAPAILSCHCGDNNLCHPDLDYVVDPGGTYYLHPRKTLLKCIGKTMDLSVDRVGQKLGMTSVQVEDRTVQDIYTTMCTISIFFMLIVFGCYAMSPRLQAWPGKLEILKSVGTK